MKTVVLALAFMAFTVVTSGQGVTQEGVKEDMKRVADWQIEHFRDSYSKKEANHPLFWANGALYVGMVKWAEIANDDRYWMWMKKIGAENNWKLHNTTDALNILVNRINPPSLTVVM